MRLFVALDIPDEVRAGIATLVGKLRDLGKDGRWARIEGLHVTLKFIGEVPSREVNDVKAALCKVEFPSPIAIQFAGLGFFPNSRRPRVLWAGVNARRDLGALASRIDEALSAIGVANNEEPFSPHLTLARLDSPNKKLGALHSAIDSLTSVSPPEFGNMIAKEFHLYQSVLKPGGAEYTRMATFASAGSKSE